MKIITGVMSGLMLVAGTVTSFAAVLERATTAVSAVTSAGPAKLAVGQNVTPGMRLVVAGRRGEVAINFGSGCTVALKPGQVYTVPAVSPCDKTAQKARDLPAEGAVNAQNTLGSDQNGFDMTPVAIGGLGLGIATAVILGTRNSDKESASFFISR